MPTRIETLYQIRARAARNKEKGLGRAKKYCLAKSRLKLKQNTGFFSPNVGFLLSHFFS